MKKIVLFASGSGSNVENIAKYFKNDGSVEIKGVFCNNPNAYVIERCTTLGIPCRVFGRNEFRDNQVILEELQQINPDLIVLAGFLWLIPSAYIRQFSDKIINIHPALLPKFGGKGMYGDRVHQAVVENKEKESGITIHYVNENYDEGLVIRQVRCEVLPTDTAADVATKVHELEYQHFPETIAHILKAD
ncbi:phosphoribosylglycinamide formyltransferase [Carboxylicivirga linearis]|uniref:Phosphoribosylglycinamide formyltransferase n=1 Tax=Carboxylicivirga linearis TaxID=1628157 RepID=A0ABS5JS97_9BACT|nr:phosphoribosylglycinamide formyltransferase [Carboxylicivirga linearis]MBS2097803.1 phosphoribosylglycinamide formyltransferase [Carboxylicivirga linearis]